MPTAPIAVRTPAGQRAAGCLLLLLALSACTGGGASPASSKTPAVSPPATAASIPYTASWSLQLTRPPGAVEHTFDGVAVDPKGTVFVADAVAGRILRLDTSGHVAARFGAKGKGRGQIDPLLPQEGALIYYVAGVAADGHGHVYVTDPGNTRVDEFTASGAFVRSFGTFGDGRGKFGRPFGVAVDAADNVYVSDDRSGFANIQGFDPSGRFRVAAKSVSGIGAPGVSPTGTMFAPELDDHPPFDSKVWRFAPDGTLQATFGDTGDLMLRDPIDVAVMPSGAVVVADFKVGLVEFDPDGAPLGVAAAPASITSPQAIAVDAHGDLYVFDDVTYKLTKLVPTG